MKISWRIAGDEVRYREVARSLADLIKENPESFDEIALFTDINEHCYEDLGAIKTLSDKIRREISAIRALGVRSVGINILNTIGQNDDGWDFVEHSPYQTMVGHDGTKTFGSNCMRAPGFREYMCKKYELYANTGADFLWVDDDMRISWHGALFPCFCDRCVSDFSARVDRKFDRVSLVKALDGDGELRIYDYKTDRLSRAELEDEEKLSAKMRALHSQQLSYYKLAAERLFDRECASVEVYSTHAAALVDIAL